MIDSIELKKMQLADEARADRRMKTRRALAASIHEKERFAVALSHQGYGWEDVCKRANISARLAQVLVLGYEVTS